MNGANVADISNPAVITPIRVVPDFDLNAVRSISYSADQMLVASIAANYDILLFDVSNPANPTQVGTVSSTRRIVAA